MNIIKIKINYPGINKTHTSSELNSLQLFIIKRDIEIKDFFIGEIHQKNKISKFLGKDENVLKFFNTCLFQYYDSFFLSVTSERVRIISLMSAVGAPVGLTNLFITLFFLHHVMDFLNFF